jgi:hypothetical protein
MRRRLRVNVCSVNSNISNRIAWLGLPTLFVLSMPFAHCAVISHHLLVTQHSLQSLRLERADVIYRVSSNRIGLTWPRRPATIAYPETTSFNVFLNLRLCRVQ